MGKPHGVWLRHPTSLGCKSTNCAQATQAFTGRKRGLSTFGQRRCEQVGIRILNHGRHRKHGKGKCRLKATRFTKIPSPVRFRVFHVFRGSFRKASGVLFNTCKYNSIALVRDLMDSPRHREKRTTPFPTATRVQRGWPDAFTCDRIARGGLAAVPRESFAHRRLH